MVFAVITQFLFSLSQVAFCTAKRSRRLLPKILLVCTLCPRKFAKLLNKRSSFFFHGIQIELQGSL